MRVESSDKPDRSRVRARHVSNPYPRILCRDTRKRRPMIRDTWAEREREDRARWSNGMRDCVRDHGGRACHGVLRAGRHSGPAAETVVLRRGRCWNRSSPRSMIRFCSHASPMSWGRAERFPGGARSIPGGSGSCCLVADGLVAFAGFQAPVDPHAGDDRVGRAVSRDSPARKWCGARVRRACSAGMGRSGRRSVAAAQRRRPVVPSRDRTQQRVTKASRSIGSPGGCGFRIPLIISRPWPPPCCGRL